MKVILYILTIFSILFISGCSDCHKNSSKIIIKFSSWGSRTEYNILKNVISDYEKINPSVKIEFIHVPENYFRKLHLLYASKTAPDVVFINNTYAPLYIKSGLLEDLSSIIDKKVFYKSSLDCFSYNDKIYAIPRDISNLVIYVNKNIVKNSDQIKTIEDLRLYAKRHTNKKHFGLNYESNPVFWLYYLE